MSTDNPLMWTDANKLRLLALWFDKYDMTNATDRQEILDDGPGKQDVQHDLRRIADRLDQIDNIGTRSKPAISSIDCELCRRGWHDHEDTGRE